MLREADESMSPKEIADALKKESSAVRYLLSQMVRDGAITRQSRGKYNLDKIPNIPNNANILTTLTSSQTEKLANVSDAKITPNIRNASQDMDSEALCEDVRDVSDISTEQVEPSEPVIAHKDHNVTETSQDVVPNDFVPDVYNEGEKLSDVTLLWSSEEGLRQSRKPSSVKDPPVAKDEKIANNIANNFTNNITNNSTGGLSEKLNEYLSDCPESFQKFIKVKMQAKKLPLSKAVEASM